MISISQIIGEEPDPDGDAVHTESCGKSGEGKEQLQLRGLWHEVVTTAFQVGSE